MGKRIAIVGGGYLGAELAKAMDQIAEVTLIEPRSHFVHASAMIRAVVQPSLVEESLIPYDRLLKRGRVVAARATDVDGECVTLEDGTRVEADYIVVATGSDYATPFKPKGADIDGLRAANQETREKLLAAKTVGIIGAGAVGVELAGEIAHAMPDKEITLITKDDKLFAGKPDSLGASLSRKLKRAGVELILGKKAEGLASLTEPHAGSLTLDGGAERRFDLIFPVLGARAASELLKNLPGAEVTAAERIKTDGYLRPSSLPNVFAAGDVADPGDNMTIVAVSRQLPWLRKTLTGLITGRKLADMKTYRPWGAEAPILLPLGPVRGNSFLMLFTAGDWVTQKMKGAHLFVSKYQKLLNRH
ncbi:FAD-dependent oxidoreductase [Sulfitobacter sp. KE34]|uniref:FAD-dependent oxidoreductase n=1 Tax=Sulfitobacter faviae TaxID=1775881 RepID=A0AAX3LPP9_9RHOB|nr:MULTISPECIES: FAD-dependent oxidoreductase [Sulfitobacter]MDF3350018.1 FAD-dependent oxidoreductase [Sulfitobacter sp. KE12]MDF3353690.1 FAD-dependent oxidoreductase [Sulfitobacter sp. KE27]MDF3357338.1 FAD-dependent oxidoreductase [Sulfitobacter sp. KE33]MDF3361699.1 FAD-dependent oxidoreductase [Sulfitobacter sp. Ks41]MDF3364762.1 FAD-dependent oxidoreductase [Sulfitobacter sp. Ks34]